MNEQERKRVLQGISEALKKGRDERRTDLREMEETRNDEMITRILRNESIAQELCPVTKIADRRGMLDEGSDREQVRQESKPILAVKENELYRKRPSVRALKKHRADGRSI